MTAPRHACHSRTLSSREQRTTQPTQVAASDRHWAVSGDGAWLHLTHEAHCAIPITSCSEHNHRLALARPSCASAVRTARCDPHVTLLRRLGAGYAARRTGRVERPRRASFASVKPPSAGAARSGHAETTRPYDRNAHTYDARKCDR